MEQKTEGKLLTRSLCPCGNKIDVIYLNSGGYPICEKCAGIEYSSPAYGEKKEACYE